MLNLPEKLKFMLFSMAYGMMITVPAVADDIEIYTTAGTTASTSQANILFILDTSGSMSNPVQTRPPYDPAASYSGGAGCFADDRAYILPYGSFYAWIHCDATYSGWYGTPAQLSHVKLDKFVCKEGENIKTTGYFTGRLSQYRGSSWRNDITALNEDDFVECEADSGVHGETDASSLVWASTSSGPWSSVEAESINWGSVGFGATLNSGHYLNYLNTAPVTSSGTRIEVMQDVIEDLLNSTSGVNVGLMRFDSNSNGGMVAAPVDDIGDATHKENVITQLNAMGASGGTPLSETFYEAARYFSGAGEDYGNSSSPFSSVAASKSGGSYISPIADECQKNYAVLLTDGEPTGDSPGTTRMSNLGIGSCTGNCLDEIAKSIATNDQSSGVTGDQFVSTFTIGFAIDNQLLLDTANESFLATGTGKRYLADDAISLADTLNKVFASVFDADTTFSSPAVAVNAFNRSTHLDDLYFTLFQPAESPHWVGNLKKYKLDFFVDALDSDGDGDFTERLPLIVDADGVGAVQDGFFSDTSRSIWTDGADDGAKVSKGGAANEFVTPRNVYTYTDTYNNNNGVFTPDTPDLTSSANEVAVSNAAITEAMLGIAVAAPEIDTGIPRRESVINWVSGIDVLDSNTDGDKTDARLEMGDPLHSEPALVQYGGTIASPDLVAYVATNDGYLHAFDADDGAEIFSFIPQELLTNMDDVMNEDSGNKAYGLDGNVVAWVNDQDGNGQIDGADHVYLYIGMRRGGRNIYSIDVTDRTNPSLRWVIKGGTDDYAGLGQTWSSVNVEKIKDGAAEKTVLIFGGGYDTNQDGATVRSNDSVGRAVFIADADSGKLLWSGGPDGSQTVDDMDYSVPARVKPLDMKGDGFIDRLYVADMGGQIFRFDIDNNNSLALSGSVTGGRIADFAGGGKKNARRFYYPPDVALIAEKGKAGYLAVGIASGYRAHPLNTEIQDRIYLFKDNDVYNTRTSYTSADVLGETDLYDATLNLVSLPDGADAAEVAASEAALTALESKQGWLIKLDDETNTDTWVGEKGLSETLFVEGVLIVTTYLPDTGAATSACSIDSSGTGKVFFLDVLDASASYPSSADTRSDRYDTLDKSGIPPSPNVIITKGGEPTLCIGTECEAAEFSKGIRKTHWYEVEK